MSIVKIFFSFLKFNALIFIRWIRIFFKKNRDIETIHFSFNKDFPFKESFLIIQFEFINAIWFKIENIRKTDFTKPIVLNPS